MASVTPTDIANMALALLIEAPINSLDEDDNPARLIAFHFDTTREAELLKRVWTFAVFSETVDGIQDAGGRWAYELPAGCLRPLPPSIDDVVGGVGESFQQEGNTLYMPYGGTRTIRFVGNVQDPAEWNALFTEVVAAALAIKIAHGITGKASMIQAAQQAYDRAVSEASRVNAIMKMGRAPSGLWSHARGDYRLPANGYAPRARSWR